LLDQVNVLCKDVLNVGLLRISLCRSTESTVELADHTLVLHLMHLIPVDEVSVVPPASEVQVGLSELKIAAAVSLCLLTLLHEANERHQTSSRAHHDDRDIV